MSIGASLSKYLTHVRIKVVPKSLQSFPDKGFRGLATNCYSQ